MADETNTPRVHWSRCGESDPEKDGPQLTINDAGYLAVLFFRDGKWFELEHENRWNLRNPSHWAAMVDAVPLGDLPFEFDWVKTSDRLPEQYVHHRVVWADSSKLRIAGFDGTRWMGAGRDIGAPDWWAPAERDFVVRRKRTLVRYLDMSTAELLEEHRERFGEYEPIPCGDERDKDADNEADCGLLRGLLLIRKAREDAQ